MPEPTPLPHGPLRRMRERDREHHIFKEMVAEGLVTSDRGETHVHTDEAGHKYLIEVRALYLPGGV